MCGIRKVRKPIFQISSLSVRVVQGEEMLTRYIENLKINMHKLRTIGDAPEQIIGTLAAHSRR
jgi:hypothetical protein